MVSVRGPVPARLRHGHLVDRVPVVRGRDGEHIRPGCVGPGARVHLRCRPLAGLRRRLAGRLRDAGHGLRVDTGDHRRADGHHTGLAVLPDDGRQIG